MSRFGFFQFVKNVKNGFRCHLTGTADKIMWLVVKQARDAQSKTPGWVMNQDFPIYNIERLSECLVRAMDAEINYDDEYQSEKLGDRGRSEVRKLIAERYYQEALKYESTYYSQRQYLYNERVVTSFKGHVKGKGVQFDVRLYESVFICEGSVNFPNIPDEVLQNIIKQALSAKYPHILKSTHGKCEVKSVGSELVSAFAEQKALEEQAVPKSSDSPTEKLPVDRSVSGFNKEFKDPAELPLQHTFKKQPVLIYPERECDIEMVLRS